MLPPGFWDSERARLSADIADTVLRVLIAGGTSGVELLPQSARVLVNWDIFNQHATDWLKIFLGDVSQPAQFADQNRVAWNWARELTDVTRRGVMDDINAWVQSGDPLPELEKRLMRNQAFSSNRARMVAATEVTRTYASGNLMAWSASGLVSGKRWRTAVDERVCPICGPMHMTIVEIDQDWQFTQDMREASPELDRALKSIGNAAFTAPPAHVNCRCWLSPVVFEAMDPDELDEQRFDKDQRRAAQQRQTIADEIAFIESITEDPFENIRPPEGRAPRGLGQEYAARRRIVSKIKTQQKYRADAERQLAQYRGQTGTRARWRIDVASERVRQLNKGISTMLDIADAGGDWGFAEELIDGIIEHISALRGMST